MDAVLALYPGLEHAKVSALEGGLINRTFRVEAPSGTFVLQALHAIFKPELHEDIEAVTAHLAKKGLPTPRLVRSKDGALYQKDADGIVWRVMTFVDAQSYAKLPNLTLAHEAGALVARFHRATDDLQHTFAFQRSGVHDTAAHLRKLTAALSEMKSHRHYAKIAPVGEEILRRAASLKPIDERRRRIVHGDLKVSNLLFDREGRGVCLCDLDTLAHMPLAHEMGDAWRSWCNPLGEDATETRFDLELFSASAKGYLENTRVAAEDRDTLVAGIETITLELASRFCADALLEVYFGWNPQKYPDRSTHNLVRAQGQLSLARSVDAQRAAIERTLAEAQ